MVEGGGSESEDRDLAKLDPVTMTQVLLLTLARGQLDAIEVTPSAGGGLVRGERAGHGVTLANLSSEAADALTARISLLAGLDLSVESEQLGRLRTSVAGDSGTTEHLVAVRGPRAARTVEVRALVRETLVSTRADGAENRSIGTYELGEEVGRGGMGVVYRGEHLTLQKPVAIKVLHHGIGAGGEAATRLLMEARAACRARHPAIVDVTDIGRLPDGRTFLVMELVEAPTLDIVLRDGPLEVGRVMRIAAQVTSALAAAAGAGVVHRDLKPGNLFLLPDDAVKITDFGVARVRSVELEPSTTSGIAGTAWYMSPEQALGRPTDTRSDLYALGVVMFEMLTGRVPFDGESTADILAAHRTQPVSALVGPAGLVGPEVQAIVKRALEKEPENRFQTPGEMLRSIEAAGQSLAGDRGRWPVR